MAEDRRAKMKRGNLLQSGIFLSAAGLLTGLGNYLFQGIMGRQLELAEFGYFNSTLGLIGLLGLPVMIASNAITHYIAHFQAIGDEARLLGLLVGCRKFLLRLTIAVSVLAVLLVKPLSDFFHFPRSTLMMTALVCALTGLWGTFASVLCQGLAWFKRLAFIGLGAVGLRLLFGFFVTLKFPQAEAAVLASAVALLSNLALLYWKDELVRPGEALSPWNREFAQYLIVAGACVGGAYCFSQGDVLVAQRYFPGNTLGSYSAAALLARALPLVVAPLLTVLFTSRSGHRTGSVVREQFKLLGLYAVGLVTAAAGLMLLRGIGIKGIFQTYNPEAADMVARLAVTMVFVGLLQALGLWALASRWLKVALLYGGLGLSYWLILLWLGKSPKMLLQVMPITAAVAFAVLLTAWAIALYSGIGRARTGTDAQSRPHDDTP